MVKKMVNSATATVAQCFGGYALPEGLTEGEIVRLLQFDHGYYAVECHDGRRFQVASNCIILVPAEFYANHRAETFLKRMRALFRSGDCLARLCISTSFKYLRFSVFGDDNKPRGSLEIHKDAILNLGSEFRERIGRRLLAMRVQSYPPS
jgi:hypothetical protein